MYQQMLCILLPGGSYIFYCIIAEKPMQVNNSLFPFQPYAGYGICRYSIIEILRESVNGEFLHNAIFFCAEDIVVCKAVTCDLMNCCG